MVTSAARSRPTAVAVEDPNGHSATYAELDAASDLVAAQLHRRGVGLGDRVGIIARKTVDTIAAVYGVLKAGAAYVPVDVTGPLRRAAQIFQHCAVKAVFVDHKAEVGLRAELEQLGLAVEFVRLNVEATEPQVRQWAAEGRSTSDE